MSSAIDDDAASIEKFWALTAGANPAPIANKVEHSIALDTILTMGT
jgi:hypothetical protein